MEILKAGDTVRHKSKIHLNGGVAFNVVAIDDDRALCAYFDRDQVDCEEWFDIADLILVNKAEEPFFFD